jgi:hypothetical protein
MGAPSSVNTRVHKIAEKVDLGIEQDKCVELYSESTVKPMRSKGSGEPSKPIQPTGGQKKRRSSRTKQETKTPSKLPGSVF